MPKLVHVLTRIFSCSQTRKTRQTLVPNETQNDTPPAYDWPRRQRSRVRDSTKAYSRFARTSFSKDASRTTRSAHRIWKFFISVAKDELMNEASNTRLGVICQSSGPDIFTFGRTKDTAEGSSKQNANRAARGLYPGISSRHYSFFNVKRHTQLLPGPVSQKTHRARRGPHIGFQNFSSRLHFSV